MLTQDAWCGQSSSRTFEPLLTVVLPTRNRADTLVHSLATATRQSFDSAEILVSDNSSDDDTANVVKSLADDRVTYVRTPRRMGMSEHWQWAVEHARGKWVTFMGDDDGLAPMALTKVARVIESHPDAEYVRTLSASYFWPDVLPDGIARLCVTKAKGKRAALPTRLPELLDRVLAGRSTWRNLPLVYSGGWVLRSALERIRSPSGQLFLAQSPDVYSGVALALTLRSAYQFNEVLYIGGTSPHSIGLSTTKGGLCIEGAPASQFLRETERRVHGDLFPDAGPLSLDHALFLDAWLHARHLHDRGFIDWTQQVQLLALDALSATDTSLKVRELSRARQLADSKQVDWARVLRAADRQHRHDRAWPARMARRLLRKLRQLSGESSLQLSSTNVDLDNVSDAATAMRNI